MLLVAGAAAGVAAIFKAPATGAVFALEVPYQDDFARHMLLPALVGAATGYLTFVAFHGTDPLFPIERTPPFDYRRPRSAPSASASSPGSAPGRSPGRCGGRRRPVGHPGVARVVVPVRRIAVLLLGSTWVTGAAALASAPATRP